jgi:hypothetical protein
MRTAGSILGIALIAALAACAHQRAQTAGAQAARVPETSAAACPIAQLRGVHATTADIKDGVAITFTAPHNELSQLRDNVKAMAKSNDKQGDAFAACPCAEHGTAGAAEAMPGEHGRTLMQPPAAVVTPRADSKVEEISTGAILRLTAKDTSQVAALRTAARENVHAFKKSCVGHGLEPAVK